MMHKTLCVVSPSPPPKHSVTEIGANIVVLNGSWASAQRELNQFFQWPFFGEENIKSGIVSLLLLESSRPHCWEVNNVTCTLSCPSPPVPIRGGHADAEPPLAGRPLYPARSQWLSIIH